MTSLQKKIRQKFGDDAKTTDVDGILIVHMDNPGVAEVQKRIDEVRGGIGVDDDCPLCQDLAKNPPQIVIYDKDSILCLGQDQVGAFASGKPRATAQA